MNMEILNQLVKTVDKDKLLEMYNIATSESVTQEELDKALEPKKKSSMLKIEKELLASYCEAVADCKRVKNNEMTLSEVIEKHSKRISESQIWE